MTGIASPEELSVDTLLPIQCGGVFNSVVRSYERGIQAQIAIKPVTAAPYREAQNYLILDGHHRAVAAHSIGCLTVNALVLHTDEALQQAHVISSVGCDNLEELWERYEQLWLPRLVARGIKRVADLPVLSGAISQRY